MVRLTVDVISNCFARINPVKERELDARGLKIPAIENLGVTQDQFDTLDFTDNEIKKLENFPRFTRLKSLLLSNNHVVRINSSVGEHLVNLDTLILTNNRIANLSEIDNLSTCKNLVTLSLINNPVVRRQHYRLYVIHKIPSLKVLDFSKIKPTERKDAARLFSSAAGKLMEQDVSAERTFEPGDGLPSQNPMANLTDAQKQQVRDAIAGATTAEEVDRIERQLKAGILPAAKFTSQPHTAAQPAPPPPPQTQVVVEPETIQHESTDTTNDSAMEDDRESLTAEKVMNMKVAELKDELKARGQSVTGLKKALQDRLLELIQS